MFEESSFRSKGKFCVLQRFNFYWLNFGGEAIIWIVIFDAQARSDLKRNS
jgi:hypothetical protein